MRPKIGTLLDNLQMGHYLVDVDEHGRAHALPVSSRESEQFIREIIGRCD